MKKKIIIISVILLIAVITVFTIIKIKQKKEREITGEEMFIAETGFMNNIKNVSEQLDMTVSLYLNGNINTEAYLQQMNMVKQQMILFLAEYREFNEYFEVKLGSHTLGSKIGCESAENSYYMLSDLIDYCMMEEYYSDKEKLSYMYIAQEKEISKELYNYKAELAAFADKYDFNPAEVWNSTDTDATEGE